LRILLVEDEPAAMWALEKGLREQSYEVRKARRGDDALAAALAFPHDLVLLDLMLPGKDGLEVCRELRGRGSTVPVLMLTARDAVEDRVRGLDCGADDYLVKPYDFHELLARIRALLRRGPALRPDTVAVADVVIDRRACTVKRRGVQVELTAKEYALLEYLARRAGEVVSRRDILDCVWDGRFEPESNVVEVYVRRLRRKLDRGSRGRLLRTRRGQGYMFGPVAPAAS
jgi:DNA-binding response OmpR family regulator